MKESMESLKGPDHSTGTTEITHPSFEVWQSNTPIDNCWCLNISQSPGQEPIAVRGLQNLRSTVEFIKGFLEEWHKSMYSVKSHQSIHPIQDKLSKLSLPDSMGQRVTI